MNWPSRRAIAIGIIRPNAEARYRFPLSFPARARLHSVGRHGVRCADQARRKAGMLIARIKAGEDPNADPSVSVIERTVADLTGR